MAKMHLRLHTSFTVFLSSVNALEIDASTFILPPDVRVNDDNVPTPPTASTNACNSMPCYHGGIDNFLWFLIAAIKSIAPTSNRITTTRFAIAPRVSPDGVASWKQRLPKAARQQFPNTQLTLQRTFQPLNPPGTATRNLCLAEDQPFVHHSLLDQVQGIKKKEKNAMNQVSVYLLWWLS